MKFNPIFWKNNIYFTQEGKAHVIYRIPQVSYAYQTQARKMSTVQRLEQFLLGWRGSGQLLYVTRKYLPGDLATLSVVETKEPSVLHEIYHQGVHERLKTVYPWRRLLFLVLDITKDITNKQKGWQKFFINDLSTAIQKTFLPNQIPIDIKVLEMAEDIENRIYMQIQPSLNAEKATHTDVEWLIKRNLYRGLPKEPDLFLDHTHTIDHNTWVNLSDGTVMEKDWFSIKIYHPDKNVSHQTFLFMVDAPSTIKPLETEWLAILHGVPFPVDVCVHFNCQHPHEAGQTLYNKRKALEDQENEYISGNESVPYNITWASEQAKILEEKLRQGMPLLYASVVFAIAGKDEDELNARANNVIQTYQQYHFRLVRTSGDMAKGFYAFLPGGPLVKHGLVPQDPGFFASSSVLGSFEVGDPYGYYLGVLPNGSPVLFNPGRPMKENRSGAIGITGTLGGGKSVLKKTIMFYSLLQNALIFSIDPKDEDWVFSQLPGLKEKTKVLQFTAESDTKINPLMLSNNPLRARAIAADYLSILLDTSKAEARSLAINEALTKVYEKPHLSLNDLIPILEEMSTQKLDKEKAVEAKRCADLLKAYRNSPFGRLVFAEDTTVFTSSYQVYVASLAGLPLPKDFNAKLTENEKLAVGLMYLIAVIGSELMLKTPKTLLKVFAVDEAWALLRIPEGLRLLQDIIRMGRSFNIVPILASQNAMDFEDEGIRNNLSRLFSFRAEDIREIKDTLIMMGMDADNSHYISMFRDLKNGFCFMRDLDGRVGMVRIQPTPASLLDLFNTTVRG